MAMLTIGPLEIVEIEELMATLRLAADAAAEKSMQHAAKDALKRASGIQTTKGVS